MKMSPDGKNREMLNMGYRNPCDFALNRDGELFVYDADMEWDILAWVFGYFRASWTLRSELIADFTCRLLNEMRDGATTRVEATLRPHQRDLSPMDWIDEDDFNPAYLKRAVSILPRRLDDEEWRHSQDYWREKDEFPAIDLADDVFVYTTVEAVPVG